MRVAILGGAGVLGSLLADTLTRDGHTVAVVDIQRPYEAWRLHEGARGAVRMVDHSTFRVALPSGREVAYHWMYAENFDFSGYDVVIDAAIGSADRPMGLTSPREVAWANLSVPLSVYARYGERAAPVIIYPSSFNAMYGHQVITPRKLPDPANAYGWTKAAAELLYRALAREKEARVVITRVGSAYGPKGRSDELPHRLILDMLSGKERVVVRSPRARRLWTYSKDVAAFYSRLLERLDLRPGEIRVYHVAGNRAPGVVENVELARIIAKVVGWEGEIVSGVYEPGEALPGPGGPAPIEFRYETDLEPRYTLEDGLRETAEWFRGPGRRFYAL